MEVAEQKREEEGEKWNGEMGGEPTPLWEVEVRPLYKWVGGKAAYLDTIKSLMPDEYNVYHEPFFGGGALYFDLEPRLAMVSDASPYNINFLKAAAAANHDLIDQVRDLVDEWNGTPQPKRDKLFKASRNVLNARIRDGWGIIHVGMAAAFYAIVRGAFNGMWRLNKSGYFNNPSNGGEDILFDEEAFRRAGEVLSHTVIRHCDFGGAIRDAGEGDFVFLDPPYFGTWTGYGESFGVPEHYRLRQEIVEAVKRGVKVMATVNDCPSMRAMYRGFRVVEMERRQNMAASGDKRGVEGDIVIMGGY